MDTIKSQLLHQCWLRFDKQYSILRTKRGRGRSRHRQKETERERLRERERIVGESVCESESGRKRAKRQQ